MSSQIFPYFRGFTWGGTETPITSTRVSKHVSGREVRFQNFKYPLYAIELKNTNLSSSPKETDWNLGKQSLQRLQAFFLNRAGQFDPFCLMKSKYTADQNDSQVYGAQIGVGDGSTASFTCMRFLDGGAFNPAYSEPVGQIEPNGANVYVDGTPQVRGTAWNPTYPNVITFAGGHIPGAGAIITADYQWYFRVRFAEDSLEFVNKARYLWEVDKLSFQTVKYP